MMSSVAVLLVLLAYGHAIRLAKQECTSSADCPKDKLCSANLCEDPCPSFCGENTVCQVKWHTPVCRCRQGYNGDPMQGCTESVIEECSFNGDCPLDKACEQHRCVDPCSEFCGSNTDCKAKRHAPVCSCREGFVGDPILGCTDSALQGCSFNGDCPLDKVCERHICEDPCLNFCGNNTVCQVKRHVPVCSCHEGFIGEPMLGCTDSAVNECSFNGDCPLDKSCEKHKCEDPCQGFCGSNTVCQVKRHTPVCSCREGFIGEPMLGCTESALQECSVNGDCPLDKACEKHKCEDPCQDFCGKNTVCKVKRHTPVCSCREGFISDPVLGCTDSAVHECSFNGDCPLDKTCEQHKCEDPCLGLCGNNTVCQVKRHTPVCSCLQGFVGDPMLGCTGSVIHECSFNGDCPLEKTCEKHKCEDPCLGFCGNNTVCQVKRHVPVCSCVQGFTGEPMQGCTDSAGDNDSTTKAKKKFIVPNEQLTWLQASDNCQYRGMHLATIGNEKENNDLIAEIKQKGPNAWVWVGATDVTSEGQWYWETTRQLVAIKYNNWHDRQPNGGAYQNCMMYNNHKGEYKWTDWQCNSQLYFACEYY